MEDLTKYFGSDEFKDLVDIIKKYDMIDQENLKYEAYTTNPLSAREFGKVCDTLFFNLKPTRVVEGHFNTYYVDYEGIRFYLAIGQGSTYWTKKMDG